MADDEKASRLSHPVAQVVMRLLLAYAKRAAKAYVLCGGPGESSWDEYYGLACTEDALRDVLRGYVQHGYLFIDESLRCEAMHVGQGAAAVAECKRAADALEARLRRAGIDERGMPRDHRSLGVEDEYANRQRAERGVKRRARVSR